MSDRLRVAVIGAGYFASFHYDAWSRIPGVDLVAACDRDLDKAEAIADRFGIEDWFRDAFETIGETNPHMIDIATPPASHEGLIGFIASRGIDMICQKPFCGELKTAERMVTVAKKAGVMLTVHENFRFQPWYRKIRSLLDEGLVGTPYQVTFRLRPGDGQGPDAYLSRQPYFQTMPRFLIHETGIHFIDTFRYLMGDVQSVYADLRQLNPAIAGEDAGLVQFTFTSGARGMFDGNRLADHAAENRRLTMGEMWLDGSKGTLRLNGDGCVFFRPHESNQETEVAFEKPESGFGGDSVLAFQQHIVSHLVQGTALETEAASYLTNLRIEEAIYRSAETGQRIDL